ncbi:hypothetical protein HDU86_005206 [Geranomyces michiganensis]|nr:hypothetical protein HDU86_005206 [Geranomyces michiganensis]
MDSTIENYFAVRAVREWSIKRVLDAAIEAKAGSSAQFEQALKDSLVAITTNPHVKSNVQAKGLKLLANLEETLMTPEVSLGLKNLDLQVEKQLTSTNAGILAQVQAQQAFSDEAADLRNKRKRASELTNTPLKKRVPFDINADDAASGVSDDSDDTPVPSSAWISKESIVLKICSDQNVTVGTVNVHQIMSKIQSRLSSDASFVAYANDRKYPFEYL